MGTVKELDVCGGGCETGWAAGDCGCGGGGDGLPPFGGSLSISMELRELMAERAESRLRCSGGRFRGWVSVSIFFRREEEDDPGSVACRARERGVRGLDSRADAADGDSGRAVFLVGDLEALVGLSGDLVGDGGWDWK